MQTVADPYLSRPWLSHYADGVPADLPAVERSIWEVLEDTCARFPGETAFVLRDYPMTYGRLLALARRMSEALAAAGVERGDVVLLLLPNVPHFPIAYYATLRLGATVASAPPTSVARELEYYIRDSGAKIVVTLDLLYDKVAGIWEACGVEQVIVGKVTDFMPAWVKLAAPFSRKVPKPNVPVVYGNRVSRMLGFLNSGRGSQVMNAGGPDDVALLQYTGGTTGLPKAAMLTHRSLLSNASQMRSWFPSLREGNETIMAVLPFFHVYGVTLVLHAGLLLGARTILFPAGWVPGEIFDAIRRYRPSVFPGVPTLYVALLHDRRSREYDLSSIDICISGGAPLPAEVKREFEELTGGQLLEGYGLTEASPCTHAQPSAGPGKPSSIGIPVPGTDARIINVDTGEAVPVGETGELLVRGPQVMAGYWNRPEETESVLAGGWLHTGDIARMDDNGFFYISDRIKDLIITGGENIYPREVEEVLFEHPKVKEAAVAGVPHRYGGEIAKAFIVLKTGESATKGDIMQFASQRLAKHKVPRDVEFRDELPKSATGKIMRRLLSEEERDRQAERVVPRRKES